MLSLLAIHIFFGQKSGDPHIQCLYLTAETTDEPMQDFFRQWYDPQQSRLLAAMNAMMGTSKRISPLAFAFVHFWGLPFSSFAVAIPFTHSHFASVGMNIS